MVKNPPANAGEVGYAGSIPGLGRSPGGGQDNPFQCSCLENPHGQRSLAGYNPWGHKESDMTEQLSTAQLTPNFQSIPPQPLGKHKSVLYVCESIS